ncbi:hypothetical protein PC118_g5644 [Phytophthora cactorum]|uniref:Tyr recombinase domain-containing protein n=1 Tax=Phytophthora cactorum TaxID=29920 RepID=A0A329SEV3_9STRA|nr:hypothetical protein PC111_g9975 [Phytophthora cactorum]KAG2947330.1 hypothetical protein PC117_g6896 [Phytophthora cactorum]KAG2990423.1 hypothetical protein PC118_g5644 [Phytophthora cactorum]KAG3039177.1 hypothetical protein PC119_g2378 [Phytophthora cactorum]KAG3179270.1 hypothetical protein C6341_g7562 [Phytophthora cactorum]
MAVLHGVRHFFAASGYKFTIAHPYIRILLKGISRLDSSRRRKAPVSLNLLGECVSNLSMAEPFELALWGVMCLAFFFLLRRSEVVAISGSTFKWFAVRSQDIAVLNAQRHPPQEHNRSMCVSCGPRPTKARGSLPADIPAAIYVDRHGIPACVSTVNVSEIIKRAAISTGQDPRHFSSHSLCAGGATHMYRSGTDALTI